MYVSLSEASRLLGVHSTTLRRWADSGNIPVYLTPGGHRRFAMNDIEALRERKPLSGSSVGDTWASHALAQTRSELRHNPHPPACVTSMPENERQVWRSVSGRLMGVVLRFVNAQNDEEAALLDEARIIGADYAANARRMNLSLATALEAALFFRDTLIDAAMNLPEHTNLSHTASARLLRRINQMLNTVQLAVVASYETPAQVKTQGGCGRDCIP